MNFFFAETVEYVDEEYDIVPPTGGPNGIGWIDDDVMVMSADCTEREAETLNVMRDEPVSGVFSPDAREFLKTLTDVEKVLMLKSQVYSEPPSSVLVIRKREFWNRRVAAFWSVFHAQPEMLVLLEKVSPKKYVLGNVDSWLDSVERSQQWIFSPHDMASWSRVYSDLTSDPIRYPKENLVSFTPSVTMVTDVQRPTEVVPIVDLDDDVLVSHDRLSVPLNVPSYIDLVADSVEWEVVSTAPFVETTSDPERVQVVGVSVQVSGNILSVIDQKKGTNVMSDSVALTRAEIDFLASGDQMPDVLAVIDSDCPSEFVGSYNIAGCPRAVHYLGFWIFFTRREKEHSVCKFCHVRMPCILAAVSDLYHSRFPCVYCRHATPVKVTNKRENFFFLSGPCPVEFLLKKGAKNIVAPATSYKSAVHLLYPVAANTTVSGYCFSGTGCVRANINASKTFKDLASPFPLYYPRWDMYSNLVACPNTWNHDRLDSRFLTSNMYRGWELVFLPGRTKVYARPYGASNWGDVSKCHDALLILSRYGDVGKYLSIWFLDVYCVLIAVVMRAVGSTPYSNSDSDATG